MARLRTPPGVTWDVVIVDNNSTDDTRTVVDRAATSFPVGLTYLFEPRQGKSSALNTGLAAISSTIVLFSDDDVRLPPEWLDVAMHTFFERADVAYVGGPVNPMWQETPPRWLQQSSRAHAVLAILDYGAEPFCFEHRHRIPLGVNMAVRRSLISHIGGFHVALGRRGRSLLGQEQAEFFARCRRVGAHGLYVPAMCVDHLVPADRLSLRYFLRWWFWKGVSQARWYRLHGETELGVDLRRTSKVLGIPRFIYGEAVRAGAGVLSNLLRGRLNRIPDSLASLASFAGHARETWFGATQAPLTVPSPVPPV